MALVLLFIGLGFIGSSYYYWQKKPDNSIEISDSNQDSTTEKKTNDDENKEKGSQFENYMIDFFHTNDEMVLESKVSDYHKNGKSAKDNQTPDLKMSYKNKKFAVECKYRTSFIDNKITWAKEYQVKNYFNFEKETSQKVFIAIGIGGTAEKPEEVYFVPLYRLTQNFATENYIKEYKVTSLKDCITTIQKN